MQKLLTLMCMVLLLSFLAGCSKSSTVKDNNTVFSEAVKAIDTDTVSLNELATFEWDTMYTFAPFTPVESIEKIIGFSSKEIKATYNESQSQLIFVNEGKVVCSIYGYGNNLGYWISFREYLGEYLAVTPDDTVLFAVDYSGNEPVLTNVQQYDIICACM